MISSMPRAVDANFAVRLVPDLPEQRRPPNPSRCASKPAAPASPAIPPSWRTSSAPSPGPAIWAAAPPDRADAMVWAMARAVRKAARNAADQGAVIRPAKAGTGIA